MPLSTGVEKFGLLSLLNMLFLGSTEVHSHGQAYALHCPPALTSGLHVPRTHDFLRGTNNYLKLGYLLKLRA